MTQFNEPSSDKKNYNHLSLDKTKHSVEVARYMSENAERYGLNPQEMYVVGLLHDVGYLYGRENHEENGANLLQYMGLENEYTDAIYLHGKSPYDLPYGELSPTLRLLYEADMSVDKFGKRVGFKGRLEDIGERYGKDSIAYKTASEVIRYLRDVSIEQTKQEYEIQHTFKEEYEEISEEEMDY